MEKKNTLSPSEWRLMECLWDQSPRTIAQLTAELAGEKGWGKHTIISFLNRMEAKGAVTYREEGRAKAYLPAFPREEATRKEAGRFLDRVFGGSLRLMVNSMVEGDDITEEDIRELEDMLAKAKEKTEAKKKAEAEAKGEGSDG